VKNAALALTLCMIFLAPMELQMSNVANGYPLLEIPPKVNVSEMNANATISKVNGTLWVKIDAEYKMHTVYAYGDSYLAENYGMGLVLYPESPYVMVTVTQDILEAHYPVPLDATNISVKLNGEEAGVQQDTHGYFHLFDANLPEMNWTVSPVPHDFVVTVHYEQPVSETTEAYAYLGEYAFTLPLYGRYGCSNISYALYSWYGYPPNNYRVQIKSSLTELHELQVYSVDTRGTLTPLSHSLISDEGSWVIAFSREEESSFVHGAVVVFNTTSEEGVQFPVVPFVAAFAIAMVMGATLLVYHKKCRRIGS
jgi:hypothetical protein